MQGDLFGDQRLFPVRRSSPLPRVADLVLRVKTAMGLALKECPDSAVVVAARMSELTPDRPITADALYAYTAASKTDHTIDIVRFIAFVRATGARWLWDELLTDEGLIVLEGEEARLAELGALKQEQERIAAAVKGLQRSLKEAPVRIRPRERR